MSLKIIYLRQAQSGIDSEAAQSGGKIDSKIGVGAFEA